MKPVKFLKFMGKIWALKYLPASSLGRDKGYIIDGLCDPPDKKNKAIKIRKNVKGKAELETYIHEGQHACNDSLSEEYVQESSSDLANMLWRIGYRRIIEDAE